MKKKRVSHRQEKSSIGNEGVGGDIDKAQKFFSSLEYVKWKKLSKRMQQKFLRLVNES